MVQSTSRQQWHWEGNVGKANAECCWRGWGGHISSAWREEEGASVETLVMVGDSCGIFRSPLSWRRWCSRRTVLGRSSSNRLQVASGSVFSPGLQQCFPAAWASPNAGSRSGGLRISMSCWRMCCQGWRYHSLCTSTRMCWLLGSRWPWCCLSASRALAQEVPCCPGHADRGARRHCGTTRGGHGAPEQPAFVGGFCGPLQGSTDCFFGPHRGCSPLLTAMLALSTAGRGKLGDVATDLQIIKHLKLYEKHLAWKIRQGRQNSTYHQHNAAEISFLEINISDSSSKNKGQKLEEARKHGRGSKSCWNEN